MRVAEGGGVQRELLHQLRGVEVKTGGPKSPAAPSLAWTSTATARLTWIAVKIGGTRAREKRSVNTWSARRESGGGWLNASDDSYVRTADRGRRGGEQDVCPVDVR